MPMVSRIRSLVNEAKMHKLWKWALAASALLVAIPNSATAQAACTGMPGEDPRFCDTGFRWYRTDFATELDLKLTSDANSTIAAIAPWTETDIGGPHNGESTPAIDYRTIMPFRGTPSVLFRGSGTNNQGAQWVMWQGKGFRGVYHPILGGSEFTRPLDLAYYTTVGWQNTPSGKSGSLVGIMTPGTPLDTDGTLDEDEGDGDPLGQTWGFYIDTSANLRAVVLDSTAKLIDVDTGIDIEGGKEYQLGFTSHVSGWDYSGEFDRACVETTEGPATQSWIRWYVNGNLEVDLPAHGFGPAEGFCIQIPPNMVPGIAHVRIGSGSGTAPMISRMGYGFSYFDQPQ
jgi:hypothetical protein